MNKTYLSLQGQLLIVQDKNLEGVNIFDNKNSKIAMATGNVYIKY